MSNYYDILEISKSAEAGEIKRAYFRMAKKYTPEKSPDEFKQIRAAYETLSDKFKRAKYDCSLIAISEVPEEAVGILTTVLDYDKRGQFGKMIEVLVPAIKTFPKVRKLKQLLAKAYTDAGSSGKALKLYGELLKAEPENPEYLHGAAVASFNRGWSKKAFDYIEKAIAIAPGIERYYITRIDLNHFVRSVSQQEAVHLYRQAIQSVREAGGDTLILLLGAFSDSLSIDDSTLDADTRYFFDLLVDESKNVAPEKLDILRFDIIHKILPTLLGFQQFSVFPGIRTIVENIECPDLMQEQYYKMLEMGYLCCCATENGIPRALCALAYSNLMLANSDVFPFEPQEIKDEIFLAECEILATFDALRLFIIKLKNEFTSIYALASSFLDATLKSSNQTGEFEKRIKQIDKIYERSGGYGIDWSCFGEDIFDIPKQEQRRVVKIGRNDPCFCGSGKKYKKCCYDKN